MEDILTVVVIFVVDIIKTSVLCTPQNDFSLLVIFAKSSIADVRLGSECASESSRVYTVRKSRGRKFLFQLSQEKRKLGICNVVKENHKVK